MRCTALLLTAIVAASSSAVAAVTLSSAAQSLFDYSMQVQDARWSDAYKYIWYSQTAGELNTRFTAWYTAGLLHRNQVDDVANAKAALENILNSQMTSDFDSAWYGTYKVTLDTPEPTANSSYWPPVIYTTYDPNWREFIGTQLVQIVELFADQLGPALVARIEDALFVGAIGEMRRNGSYPAGDNLVLAYSNPALMRCLTVGWIGARRHNATLIAYADTQASLLLDLFRRSNNTLGEYNAPTYYGMDVWALAANLAYGPANATMTTTAAPYILTHLWRDVAAHYNPYLRNLVGPYDRAYTRDMTAHSAVLSLWWWGLWGRDTGGQPPLGDADLLYDVSQGAALALVMDTVAGYVEAAANDSVADALTAPRTQWEGERVVRRTLVESLEADAEVRVATSWVSAPLMIGAEALAEQVNRGAQFVPAIVHWMADPAAEYVGFWSLYPTASTINATASRGRLEVAYPNTTQAGTDMFTFAVSGIPPSWGLAGKKVEGLEELPCLRANVSAPGLVKLPVALETALLEDHYYYNVSYVVPEGFEGVPSVVVDMEYTC